MLYPLVLLLAYPLVRLRLWLRGRREPEYRQRVAERFGHVPPEVPEGPVWFHTVSAGESIAAAPVIRQLAEEFAGTPFLVTTMTPTGSQQVLDRLGDVVAHCYAPYDFGHGVRRFFARVRPRLLVLMETELWPNLIRCADQAGVPVLVVNARLSERSARGYARIASLTTDMLARIRLIACQSEAHAQRFVALGAAAENVCALGSVKFDVELPHDYHARVAVLKSVLKTTLKTALASAGRPVWIAGSTHPGEDEVVLAAHREVVAMHPNALLLLVPRHPVRGAAVLALARGAGFVTRRLRELAEGVEEVVGIESVQVVVCDTMGELQYLYGCSDVAFLAGSLVPVGGHNPIEPAICAQPLLTGPVTHNFTDVVEAFVSAGCMAEVTHAADMAAHVNRWFGDAAERARLGDIAASVVRDNRGATGRLLELLRTHIA